MVRSYLSRELVDHAAAQWPRLAALPMVQALSPRRSPSGAVRAVLLLALARLDAGCSLDVTPADVSLATVTAERDAARARLAQLEAELAAQQSGAGTTPAPRRT